MSLGYSANAHFFYFINMTDRTLKIIQSSPKDPMHPDDMIHVVQDYILTRKGVAVLISLPNHSWKQFNSLPMDVFMQLIYIPQFKLLFTAFTMAEFYFKSKLEDDEQIKN